MMPLLLQKIKYEDDVPLWVLFKHGEFGTPVALLTQEDIDRLLEQYLSDGGKVPAADGAQLSYIRSLEEILNGVIKGYKSLLDKAAIAGFLSEEDHKRVTEEVNKLTVEMHKTDE